MELVNRQDALKAIDDVLMEDEQYKVWLKLSIKNIKPVDAEPVRHARLVNASPYGECSYCGELIDSRDRFRYCPHCGAMLVGEGEKDDSD